MRVMSAGDGYKYLLRSIAAADGDRSLSTPLTRYYEQTETPWGSKSSRVIIGLSLWSSVYCHGRSWRWSKRWGVVLSSLLKWVRRIR